MDFVAQKAGRSKGQPIPWVHRPDVFREIRERGVVWVAESLGLAIKGKTIACPACRAEKRGDGDRRLPANLTPSGMGWKCVCCGEKGGPLEYLALAQLHHHVRDRGDRRRLADEARRLLSGPQRPLDRSSPRRNPVVPSEPKRPPRREVRDLLYRHIVLPSADDAVFLYLLRRGIDVHWLDEEEPLVRVLAPGAPCPAWARFGRRLWSETGHRLLLPLFDVGGRAVSLVGRRVGEERPKAVFPRGCEVKGLVMANHVARRWLAGLSEVREVVVVEGVTDFLTVAGMFEDVGAVIGVVEGAWTQPLADRIPDDAEVMVATDLDPTGDKYFESIRKTLEGRTRLKLLRWQGPHGDVRVSDINDAFRAGLTKSVEDLRSHSIDWREHLKSVEEWAREHAQEHGIDPLRVPVVKEDIK